MEPSLCKQQFGSHYRIPAIFVESSIHTETPEHHVMCFFLALIKIIGPSQPTSADQIIQSNILTVVLLIDRISQRLKCVVT